MSLYIYVLTEWSGDYDEFIGAYATRELAELAIPEKARHYFSLDDAVDDPDYYIYKFEMNGSMIEKYGYFHLKNVRFFSDNESPSILTSGYVAISEGV